MSAYIPCVGDIVRLHPTVDPIDPPYARARNAATAIVTECYADIPGGVCVSDWLGGLKKWHARDLQLVSRPVRRR